MDTKIAIFGAGGLGREVLALLRDIRTAGQDLTCIAFVVDPGFQSPPDIHGIPVCRGFSHFAGSPDVNFVVALGDPAYRKRAVSMIEDHCGPRFATIIHPLAWLGQSVVVGAGSVIMGLVSITADVRIGRHVLVNPQVSIAHDCVLEDFVTLGPAVALAGGAQLREGCELGTRACVIPRQDVGRWSRIGAGAVVTRSVPANVTMVGVPARQISERPEAWHISPNGAGSRTQP